MTKKNKTNQNIKQKTSCFGISTEGPKLRKIAIKYPHILIRFYGYQCRA